MCVEFKRKKQHNIGFPTFKLTTQISTKIIYDWLSSVVYIFYMGIISWVLCGYKVQMNM